MIDDSRLGIYEYIENLLVPNVTENVYLMNEPKELTEDDETNGFVVIEIGEVSDESEFKGEVYASARVYIEAYVPSMSRGRIDKAKYRAFEDGINEIIETESRTDNNGTYWIQEDSSLSIDAISESSTNSTFYMFVKSFVVMVGYEPSSNI